MNIWQDTRFQSCNVSGLTRIQNGDWWIEFNFKNRRFLLHYSTFHLSFESHRISFLLKWKVFYFSSFSKDREFEGIFIEIWTGKKEIRRIEEYLLDLLILSSTPFKCIFNISYKGILRIFHGYWVQTCLSLTPLLYIFGIENSSILFK